MNITIATADTGDIPAIISLAHRIWPRCYENIISQEQIAYMLELMYSPDTMTDEMLNRNIRYYLLRADGQAAGFSSFGPADDSGDLAKLHKLYLIPELHGQGLGSKLLRLTCDRATAEGFKFITLNVNRNNTAAIAAYHRNSFTRTESVDQDIGNCFQMCDYIMKAALPLS